MKRRHRHQRARAVAACARKAGELGFRFHFNPRAWPEPASLARIRYTLCLYVDQRMPLRRQAAAIERLVPYAHLASPFGVWSLSDGSVWNTDGASAIQLPAGVL